MLDGKKMWSVSAGWFDYNNDGLLDLFVSNYCKWEVEQGSVLRPEAGQRAYCHPKNYAPLPNTLYRNNGDGTFTDVSARDRIDKYSGKGMGAVIGRLRWRRLHRHLRRQRQPARISCFTTSAGKKFEEVALEAGVAYPESAQRHLRHGRRLQGRRQRRPARHLAHRHRERILPLYS